MVIDDFLGKNEYNLATYTGTKIKFKYTSHNFETVKLFEKKK
jgi:hypothetical protein